LLVATSTPDYINPSMACILHERLELTDNCAAFDIQAVCNGFLYGLATAASLLTSSGMRNAIIVGADQFSRITDYKSRNASYFGDGATEEGVFHETLNLASIMWLPILFVCENNLLSSHLHISERQPSSDIIRFAVANNINASVVDGNDLLEVAQKTSEIVTKIRSTNQPAFKEANTYRLYGHVGYEIDYEVGLNREEDLKAWNNRDPIEKYKEWLIGKQKIKAKVISEIHETVTTFVEEKWNEAVQAPDSNQNQLLKNVYFEEAE
jgi:pyruvate dehydrogenase E1 component alpha subunit